MTTLTHALALGALLLLGGYLFGALLQNDFAFMQWPLPVRLTVLLFSLSGALGWLLISIGVKNGD